MCEMQWSDVHLSLLTVLSFRFKNLLVFNFC